MNNLKTCCFSILLPIVVVLCLTPLHTQAAFERSVLSTYEMPSFPASMRVAALEGVFWENGSLHHIRDGQSRKVDHAIELGGGRVAHTDGTVLLDAKPLWRLKDGELMASDGSVLHPNGTVVYAEEHYQRREGKLVHVQAGKATPVASGRRLSDGTLLLDDGKILTKHGFVSSLLDGQIFRPSGGELQAWDTITFRDGKVTLFMDGSLFTLPRERSLTMNDGTKVFGDGRIARRTRESLLEEVQAPLPEGTVIKVAGATTVHRYRHGY